MSEKTTGAEPEAAPETPPHREPSKFRRWLRANPAISLTWKIIITTVGTLVILAGTVMLVTPGPAFVLIPIGLAILATEWEWADRWLQKAKQQALKAKEKSQAMDPRVRRRRILLTLTAFVLVVGAVATYVLTYGWPVFAVQGWDWVQGIAGWLPELPGPTSESLNGARPPV